MNKSQLIENVSKKSGIKKKTTNQLLELFLEEIESAVRLGNSVKLYGFGKFYPGQYSARKTHSLTPDQEFQIIEARPIFRFKPSKKLQRRIQAQESNPKENERRI